jgi:phosphatidylcholine synthase
MPTMLERPALARALVFLVHLLTASGAGFALLAMLAAIAHEWSKMFAWLGVALFVDAIDGALARKLRAAETWPRYSGDVLDLVVDYLGYVLVPAVAIVTGSVLPPRFDIAAGAAILVSSAIYFADTRMKTDGSYFRGFPATWNLIAFYLFLLRPDPYVALVVVALFVVLTFTPVYFVHPTRVKRSRPLNVMLTAAWSGLAVAAIVYDLSPPWIVKVTLFAIAVYFLLAGLSHPRQKSPS